MLIRGRDLTIANVGDSRCVAAEMRGTELVAVDLTSDQTPYRCFPLLQLRVSRPPAGTDWRCMSRCAALGVVRLAPQAAGVHHKTAGYTKMPREDCSNLVMCTASRPQGIRAACCRKDELARVKAAGARVLTLEQLDGLRVSLAPRCTECACDTCASWPFPVGHAFPQPVGSGVPQRLRGWTRYSVCRHTWL